MTDWLKRQGFSYKKPTLVPEKASRDEQEKRNKKYYDLKNHLPEDETLCFIDGVHPNSPNLSPIERLWKWMRERIMYNAYYQTMEEFRDAVLGFLRLVSGLDLDSEFGKELRSRVRDQFTPIGVVVK